MDIYNEYFRIDYSIKHIDRITKKGVWSDHTAIVKTTPINLKKRVDKMIKKYGGVFRVWKDYYFEYNLIK